MTETFTTALAELGLRGDVEVRGKLAVIAGLPANALSPSDRRRIVALGRAHGFTNVCVEIQPAEEGTFHR